MAEYDEETLEMVRKLIAIMPKTDMGPGWIAKRYLQWTFFGEGDQGADARVK